MQIFLLMFKTLNSLKNVSAYCCSGPKAWFVPEKHAPVFTRSVSDVSSSEGLGGYVSCKANVQTLALSLRSFKLQYSLDLSAHFLSLHPFRHSSVSFLRKKSDFSIMKTSSDQVNLCFSSTSAPRTKS